MKKNKNPVEESTESFVETIVVGGGPAGITAARKLQHSHPEMQILILEAGDRTGGRACSGLHLLDTQGAVALDVLTSEELEPARVRWERHWVSPEAVKWDEKDWIGHLPQWKLYLDSPKRIYRGLAEVEVEAPVKIHSPVSVISEISNSTGGNSSEAQWKLETPERIYFCRRVIWAAGLSAFQNAFGKMEAQNFMVANPQFNPKAQDFRGGIGFELALSEVPAFAEEIPLRSLLALPVKHNGVRYLTLGAFEGPQIFKSLTHVHQDLLVDPKEVLSLQKSLKRAVHALFASFNETQATERWVVSSRIGGHTLGSSWLLNSTNSTLEFVGEESLAGVASGACDILAAITSVEKLDGVQNEIIKGVPLEVAPELSL